MRDPRLRDGERTGQAWLGLAAFIVVLAVTALTACTAVPHTPPPSRGSRDGSSPVAAARPTPLHQAPPVGAFSPAPTPSLRPCIGWGFYEHDRDVTFEQPVDCGPIEFATGKVSVDSEGTPVAYTVAPGDVWAVIAKRFDLGVSYLNNINSVRRPNVMNVYPGDTINLDPHTIVSVGTENGQVGHNLAELPDPHLEQR
ncbi:LysM peptidoglycan-binding domain-containing protein [Leifsonia sp. NPDC058292]|uniref:LysM peptidoglycan-binding domain-containing protein n=1 Tax=Leifsonia sp. NPDC058292 TaxID=3346428 RepID=UPI0036DB0FB8